MNCIALEPLYRLAAQTVTPPDRRWLETWRWLLGDVQLDLWVDGEQKSCTQPLLAMMQNLPTETETTWLLDAERDYRRIFNLQPLDMSLLAPMQWAADQWGYSFAYRNEPGLAPVFAFMAHLCRVAAQQPAAADTRRQLLGETLCPTLQATLQRLQRLAATPFYQAVGAYLPALILSDLAGDKESKSL